jgi:DNA-binding transcriptional LysR family regulator
LKFEFLMTLNSVLRHGSFASAADDMGLTPSAVSLQMKRLEEYVGQPLFDRSGRTVRPTPLASDLAESIRTALDAVEEAGFFSRIVDFLLLLFANLFTSDETEAPAGG